MKIKTLNDKAWEKIFEKYDILRHLNRIGHFKISSNQMKEFREPRLMAKFDHKMNLPEIFLKNNLSILPITRGDYIISKFETYHNFEINTDNRIIPVSIPSYIQSLDADKIKSENIALNCAISSGIIAHFMDDEEIVPTVSGRMGTGIFNFNIRNSTNKNFQNIEVNNAQIEIDAAYEGINFLALIEAKMDLADDFLIRQLYYPYRVWEKRIKKSIKPIFLIYSNGIYHLYEYKFQNLNEYNSLMLVKQKNYSIEDTSITIQDIQNILQNVQIEREPQIPFPQADKFERIINICELIQQKQELTRIDVTQEYDFDTRQTNYYTDAARYLGLIEKEKFNKTIKYNLTKKALKILKLNYKQRQLAYCKSILCHKPFADTLIKYFENGVMPTSDEIVQIMKLANLYQISSEETFKRRSSSIRGWINWIIELINQE